MINLFYFRQNVVFKIRCTVLLQLKNGDVVVINLEGEVYCKRLLKQPFVNEIVLSSMNSFYKDIVVSTDQLESAQIIGVVCKTMSIKTFENTIIKYK